MLTVLNKINPHCFEAIGGNKNLCITVLSTICAKGETPTPMLIYSRKRLDEQMVTVKDSEGKPIEFVAGKTNNGWITFKTLYEYLVNDFHNYIYR